MPDIENSQKTAEKGAEWVTVNEPKTAGKTAETPEKQLFWTPSHHMWALNHQQPGRLVTLVLNGQNYLSISLKSSQ